MHRKRTKKELSDCHQLRSVWMRSGPYWEAMHRAKMAPNHYLCEKCQEVFRLREVQVDHQVPCVDVKTGWQGLQEFARRLFCPSGELMVLCQDKCHKIKSQTENKERRKYEKEN